MLGNHPSVEIPQSTEYAKEMRRWESTHTKFGAPGRPYQFQEFPKRMSRAEHVPGKGVQIVEERSVGNEDEQRNLESRGFHFGHDKAFAAVAAQQTEFGRLAAEREYAIRHGQHSERAVEEVRAAESEHGARHLPVVPETPIPVHRKRGRQPNAAAVPA